MLIGAAGLRLQAPGGSRDRVVQVGSPALWRLASLDHATTAATVAWIVTVQRYADGGDVAWLPGAVATIADLDPRWRTPASYGALMAAERGDIDAHEAILVAASARHPDDAWFPYTLGMSRLLHHEDEDGAATWLEEAARRPGAPPVHAEAARALRGWR